MKPNMRNKTRVYIELGSNSIKFSVAEIDLWPPKPLMKIEKITRLGEGVAVNNRLHPGVIQRVLDILEIILETAAVFDPVGIDVLGTGVIRNVRNRSDLSESLLHRFGLRLRVFSAEEEAVAGYLAARADVGDEAVVVMDVGGGSVEIAFGNGKVPEYFVSLPLGTRMLCEEIPTDDPTPPKQVEVVAGRVRQVFRESGLESIPSGAVPVLLGGAARALAGYASEMPGALDEPVAGYLHLNTLRRLVRTLAECTIEEREQLPGALPERGDMVLQGAIILRELFRLLKLEKAKVSLRGLYVGALFSENQALPLELAKPPIILPSMDFPPLTKRQQRGEVLFLLRRPDGAIWLQRKWEYPAGAFRIPGGGIEPGENPREAAIREVREETGFKNPRPIVLSKLTYQGKRGEKTTFSSTLFLVDVEATEPENHDSDESIEAWMAAAPEDLKKWAVSLESIHGERGPWGYFRAAALRHAEKMALQGRW